MKTDSNTYTIIYASVMVVVVAFLLAFVSSALRPLQEQNVELDKMRQILSALNITARGDDVRQLYDAHIKQDMILDANGTVISETGGFALGQTADRFVVYIAEVDGERKYVIPLFGTGLWGAIWGHIALNADRNTVYGVNFAHAGETPGLGAEIATHTFQRQFQGKQIMREGELVSIAVVRPGTSAAGQDYVDGLSGGTITSHAVQVMLQQILGHYRAFLTKAEGGNEQ